MKITISKTVTRKLGKLVDVLLHEGYFATSASAYKYVDAIYEHIYSIEKIPCRKTNNSKNGAFFIVYKPNARTSWYITFDILKDGYLIKNITNNHSSDYPHFLSESK